MAKAKVVFDEAITAAEATAIAKATSSAELPVGDHQVDCFVHIKGCIRKGEDSEMTPTASVPILAALGLAVKRMGFQRDKFLEILKDSMRDAINGEKAADIDEVTAEASAAVKKTLAALPKITRKGSTTLVGDLTVQKVAADVAAIRETVTEGS